MKFSLISIAVSAWEWTMRGLFAVAGWQRDNKLVRSGKDRERLRSLLVNREGLEIARKIDQLIDGYSDARVRQRLRDLDRKRRKG